MTIAERGGHLHVTVTGPMGEGGRRVKRQSLTAVTAELTAFERRAALVHFYRLARRGEPWGQENYAGIFGSCFD